jgi:hypothetical protein
LDGERLNPSSLHPTCEARRLGSIVRPVDACMAMVPAESEIPSMDVAKVPGSTRTGETEPICRRRTSEARFVDRSRVARIAPETTQY